MSASTPPDTTKLRLRAFLDAQFTVLLVVCFVLIAVGGGLVYTTYVSPGTESETRTVSSWTVETEYAHSAEVTESNPVFTPGTVLENRETYFTTVAPELEVTPRVRYTANEAEEVDVELRSVLVVRSVGEEGSVYWEQQEPIDTTSATGVAPGDSITAPFTLNSTAINERVASIESELGASPGEIETFVVSDVELVGVLNGEVVNYTNTAELELEIQEDTYTVSNPGVQSDTAEQTVTEPVEQTYGPLRSVGGPLVLVLGLIGSGGLLYARFSDFLGIDKNEQAYLSFRDDRSEFDEWITRVQLPSAAHDRPEAHAHSLRDLVELAIDSNTGVVEDPETERFHVVVDEYLYSYQPPFVASRVAIDGTSSEAETDTRQSTAFNWSANPGPDESKAHAPEDDSDSSTNGSSDVSNSVSIEDQSTDDGAETNPKLDNESDTTEQS